MNLQEIIQLGPLMIKSSLLVMLLAAAAGYIHLYLKIRKTSFDKSPISDLILNGMMIVFACWKLGPLIYEPSMLWTDPIKLLMVSGTADIAVLGIIIAIAYWSARLRKLGISWFVMLDAWSYILTAAMFIYGISLQQYGIVAVSILGIIVLWTRKLEIGEGYAARQTFILLGIGGMLASLWTSQTVILFQLSAYQMMAFLLSLIGIAISPKSGQEGIEESKSTHTMSGKE
ncbi:hypothetical protein E0485_09555 [Paenibacillus albiflavus]|uniref:Uncharacterized protein n=1 Tax=Paenibacillus albiflavus TaxID=2545760 RepID=A0A4R4EE45_9BACL|nr:hypothetical protein [Paenibacillus albiflavus]TCZ77717.1 hypothetical protein E0485_09555 [Paenibacillus albiflavus]